jgi:hypothetical protein
MGLFDKGLMGLLDKAGTAFQEYLKKEKEKHDLNISCAEHAVRHARDETLLRQVKSSSGYKRNAAVTELERRGYSREDIKSRINNQ